MEHYVGAEHLSPEHILDRHEDPNYIPPYYPHSWDERKWKKVFRNHKLGMKALAQALFIGRTQVAYVFSLASQEKAQQEKAQQEKKSNRKI